MAFPPLRLISRWLISLTNVIVRARDSKQGPFVSESELLGIVEAAADDDVIEHEERELIESIIEFGDTVAREMMVPRPDIVTLDDRSTVTEALDMAIAHGYQPRPGAGRERRRRCRRHRLHEGPDARRARRRRRSAGRRARARRSVRARRTSRSAG